MSMRTNITSIKERRWTFSGRKLKLGQEYDLKCTRHNVFHWKIERDHKEITAKNSQSVFRRSLFGLQFLDLWLLILFFEVKTWETFVTLTSWHSCIVTLLHCISCKITTLSSKDVLNLATTLPRTGVLARLMDVLKVPSHRSVLRELLST